MRKRNFEDILKFHNSGISLYTLFMIVMDKFSVDVLLAAVGVGFIHTITGPDHYLPFIMLARAREWSCLKTVVITTLCGAGHVMSSILLGFFGVAAGIALGRIEGFEGLRGGLAAWLLVGFGLAYALWGVRQAMRRGRGIALHSHGSHTHLHGHGDQIHEHAADEKKTATFWTLFIVFVLGPCEPLIPLFMLPAARGQWVLAGVTGLVFGIITILCMVGLVLLGAEGLKRLRLGMMERWAHTLAGAVIAASGLAIIFLGL